MPAEKKIDIVVFGATGDVGRCVCHFLHNQGKLIGVESWAPAARNLDKLNKVVGSILANDCNAPDGGISSSDPIKADCNDYDSMLSMAKRAKVVIACAGPFALYGENAVKACVEAGTDYVDITGEFPWVNHMAKKYGQEAKTKGVYVLSQSAFDSVPSDITVALGATALMEMEEKVGRAESHFSMAGGGLPVGTLNTALEMALESRGKVIKALTFGMVDCSSAEQNETSAEREQLQDTEGIVSKEVESSIDSDVAKNNMTFYSSMTGKWSLPFFMAVANIPIVHTTAEKLGYGVSQGHGFTYAEHFLSADGGNFTIFAVSIAAIILAPIMDRPFLPALCTLPVALYLFPFGLILTGLTLGGLLAIPVLLPLVLFFPGVICYVSKSINNTDLGNMKKTAIEKLLNGFKEDGLSKCEATVQSISGNVTAKVSLKSKYDPGFGFTSLCSATVAASIMERRRKGIAGTGFSTAVAAIGPKELKSNLEKVKCKFTMDVL